MSFHSPAVETLGGVKPRGCVQSSSAAAAIDAVMFAGEDSDLTSSAVTVRDGGSVLVAPALGSGSGDGDKRLLESASCSAGEIHDAIACEGLTEGGVVEEAISMPDKSDISDIPSSACRGNLCFDALVGKNPDTVVKNPDTVVFSVGDSVDIGSVELTKADTVVFSVGDLADIGSVELTKAVDDGLMGPRDVTSQDADIHKVEGIDVEEPIPLVKASTTYRSDSSVIKSPRYRGNRFYDSVIIALPASPLAKRRVRAVSGNGCLVECGEFVAMNVGATEVAVDVASQNVDIHLVDGNVLQNGGTSMGDEVSALVTRADVSHSENKHNYLDVRTHVTAAHPLDENLMEGDVVEELIPLVNPSVPNMSVSSDIPSPVFVGNRSFDSLISDNQGTRAIQAVSFANKNVGVDANSMEFSEAPRDGHLVSDRDFVMTDVASAEVALDITVQNADVYPDNENLMDNGNTSMTDALDEPQAQLVQRLETEKHTSLACGSMTSFSLDAGVAQITEQKAFKSLGNQIPQRDDVMSMTHKRNELCVSDLVWGKVKTYPWWPGQIFDRSDASDLALKYHKRDNILVAYFGDRTFAWRHKSQLIPFYGNFSMMEKQSNSDAFTNAVAEALREVSRRMELVLTCSCLPEEDCASLKYQKVVNAGIRDGTYHNSVFDRSLVTNYLKPDRLLEYIKALGQSPIGGSSRLGLVIAKAHLKAFYHSKGYPELPKFYYGTGIKANDTDIAPYCDVKPTEVAIEHSTSLFSELVPRKQNRSISKKQKRELSSSSVKKLTKISVEYSTLSSEFVSGKWKRGGQAKEQKHILEEISPLSVKKPSEVAVDHSGSLSSQLVLGKRRRRIPNEYTDRAEQENLSHDMKGKDPNLAIELDEWLPPSTRSRSFKVGEHIRRLAIQLKGSTPILKRPSKTIQKTISKGHRRGDDANSMLKRRTKESRTLNSSSANELQSQLYIAASYPLERHSFLSLLVSFFTDYRNLCVSSLSEANKHRGEVGGQAESVGSESASFNTSTPDHMTDSYWSDKISNDSSGKGMLSNGLKRKGESDIQSQWKKRQRTQQRPSSCLSGSNMDTAQHLNSGTVNPNMEPALASERSIISVEEKIMDTPTALILNFSSLDKLPSRSELIKIFCHYGPLREPGLEVLRKTNRVRVVFKRRDDAEKAFSSSGKFSIFGLALVSYKLKYLPPATDISRDYSTQGRIDVSPINDQAETIVLSGTLPVEAVSKG